MSILAAIWVVCGLITFVFGVILGTRSGSFAVFIQGCALALLGPIGLFLLVFLGIKSANNSNGGF